jgi:hypothetical protein
MRSFTFVVVACAVAAACGRGNGSTTPMNSNQPLVSVVDCVSQSDGTLVLTSNPNRTVGTSGTAGSSRATASAGKRYRLIDEAHTGVDRYVDRQVQITGKVENAGAEEGASMPAIRVTQLNSLGGCQ